MIGAGRIWEYMEEQGVGAGEKDEEEGVGALEEEEEEGVGAGEKEEEEGVGPGENDLKVEDWGVVDWGWDVGLKFEVDGIGWEVGTGMNEEDKGEEMDEEDGGEGMKVGWELEDDIWGFRWLLRDCERAESWP